MYVRMCMCMHMCSLTFVGSCLYADHLGLRVSVVPARELIAVTGGIIWIQ